MILKSYEVCNLYESLINIQQENIKFPIKFGFILIKNTKLLAPIYESIIQVRDNTFMNYAEEDGNGETIIPEDKIEAAQKELDELSEVENEVLLSTVSLKEIEEFELGLKDLEGLYPIIISEEEGE
jgi:hypothetical protein